MSAVPRMRPMRGRMEAPFPEGVSLAASFDAEPAAGGWKRRLRFFKTGSARTRRGEWAWEIHLYDGSWAFTCRAAMRPQMAAGMAGSGMQTTAKARHLGIRGFGLYRYRGRWALGIATRGALVRLGKAEPYGERTGTADVHLLVLRP